MLLNTRYLTICSFLFATFSLTAQNLEEKLILQIEQSNQQLSNSATDEILKKYKNIARQSREDLQTAAVIHALIGKGLSEHQQYETAIPYLKKAYKYRKKQGEYLPQRWALNALMENGYARKDFPFVLKYARPWISHTAKDPKALEPIYRYDRSGERYFKIELSQLIERIHPSYVPWRKKRPDYEPWEERRQSSHKLIAYYFKTFPEYESEITKDASDFYQNMIKGALGRKEYDVALLWKDKSIKIFKKHASPEEYTNFIRLNASLFRLRDSYYNGMRTDTFEHVGLELMEQYIKTCKKINRHDQVLFGYRYIGTRYAGMGDYQKAIQYLATAIKYCNQYNIPEELKKSYGGMQAMLQRMDRRKGNKAWEAANSWQANYKLKGLTAPQIERINEIIEGYRITNKYLTKNHTDY